MGGHLVHILTAQDQQLAKNFITNLGDVAPLFWIGLTDLFSEGEFHWEPGHIKATYLNWATSQPSNARLEDFVLFPTSGLWYDKPEAEYYQALCQVI